MSSNLVKPTVMFLFNSSKYAPEPWVQDGRFNVVSVDYDDTDHSLAHVIDSSHYRLNIDLSRKNCMIHIANGLADLGLRWPSVVVSFTPCTDLAVSGAAHFKRKREANPNFQQDAVALARIAEKFGCPYAVENPVSVLSTLWRKPDHCFHPYEYGQLCPDGEHPQFPDVIPPKDAYHKKTCLWTGNGFTMPEIAPVEPLDRDCVLHRKLGGKSARTKYIRSLTPRGVARAIYEANKELIMINLQEIPS